MSSAMVGRERAFCAPAVYWLSDDESTISDCWRGRATYRRKSLPSHPQRGFTCGTLPPWEPLVSPSCWKESFCLTRTQGEKGLSAYSRNFCNQCQIEEMKRNLEKSLEKIKMHWLFWLRETSRSFCFHGACLNVPLIERRKQQPYGLLKVAKLQL